MVSAAAAVVVVVVVEGDDRVCPPVRRLGDGHDRRRPPRELNELLFCPGRGRGERGEARGPFEERRTARRDRGPEEELRVGAPRCPGSLASAAREAEHARARE